MSVQHNIPEDQHGPAERLLNVVLSSSAHLWHNRPGLKVGDKWMPARGNRRKHPNAEAVKPGLFVPAAAELYSRLLEIHQLNPDLMTHFASYALLETDWRDLKVACCALMLVQPRSGQPIHGDDGSVEFYDDDDREIGEAMLLFYKRGSTKMFTPKAVLRVAQLLEVGDIAELNRLAGFCDPASKKPALGRWKSAAKKWLRIREENLPLLKGLVKAGYKDTIKKIARKAGYKPQSQVFFEVLGWKQKQSEDGHRTVGMGELNLEKSARFDGLSEEEICEKIVAEKLTYREAVGRLPAEVGLTPAIMVTLFGSLSDRELRILTPSLEQLGLLEEPELRARWEEAVKTAEDQRALNVAKNVKNRELREKLEEAADHAAQKAVKEATQDLDLRIMFLVDKSGSMDRAIEESKEALSRILAGFDPDKVHIATFDTMGTVLKPKAASRKAVQHMLQSVKGGGGTDHSAAVRAIHQSGVRVPKDAKLIVIVVGDEAGEAPARLARAFNDCDYAVAGIAMIVSVSPGWQRGQTVRGCAHALSVPFCEISVDQFEDPYQVPRALRTILEAPVPTGAEGTITTSRWLEKVMKTPIIGRDIQVA